MSEPLDVISSLYLPVSQGKLLLPNVSVAEVVDYTSPEKPDGSPDYFLGTVSWRGIRIPVISYEIANKESLEGVASSARLAVLNTIGEEKDKLRFFALLTQGIPRLVKVTEDLIKTSAEKTGPADSERVRVDGEEAIIPNLEYLESIAVSVNG